MFSNIYLYKQCCKIRVTTGFIQPSKLIENCLVLEKLQYHTAKRRGKSTMLEAPIEIFLDNKHTTSKHTVVQQEIWHQGGTRLISKMGTQCA